jgi:hypothetical protein
MTHLLSHWLGMDNPSGPVYLFLSGAGGILLTWLGSGIVAGLLFWWHNQCPRHRLLLVRPAHDGGRGAGVLPASPAQAAHGTRHPRGAPRSGTSN